MKLNFLMVKEVGYSLAFVSELSQLNLKATEQYCHVIYTTAYFK